MLTYRHVVTYGTTLQPWLTRVTDLTYAQIGGQHLVFATGTTAGGISSYRISDPDKPLALVSTQPFPRTFSYDGDAKLTVLQKNGSSVVHLLNMDGAEAVGSAITSTGSLGAFTKLFSPSQIGTELKSIGQFEIGGATYIYSSHKQSLQLNIQRMNADGSLTNIDQRTHVVREPIQWATLNQIIDVDVNGQKILVAVSGFGDFISTTLVSCSGELTEGAMHVAANGAGYSTPIAVGALQFGGQSYLIMSGFMTSTLTVFRLGQDGSLARTDHVPDLLTTRFYRSDNVFPITVDGRGFVIVGGSDGGITIFTMTPDGRLLHLQNIVGTSDTTLSRLSAMEAFLMDGRIVVLASGISDVGVTQYSIDPGQIGLTKRAGAGVVTGTAADDMLLASSGTTALRGGDGDDILITAKAGISLTGGNGADVFTLTRTSGVIRILDYEPGLDRLDLELMTGVGSIVQLTFVPQNWGMRIVHRDWVVEVRTRDGTTLQASHFTNEMFRMYHYWSPDLDPNIEYEDLSTVGKWVIGTTTADRLQGGLGPDHVHAGMGNDTAFGGAGNDIIMGEQGNDLLYGQDGDDSIRGGDGNDTMQGDAGNDTLEGEVGVDRIYGGSGNDVLLGGADNDFLYGGTGDDRLNGQAGNDTLSGESGNDWLEDLLGNNRLFGGDGQDSLTAGAGIDYLRGGAGNDSLRAGAGNDDLDGETGNDTLLGEAGNDRLQDLSGNNRIEGGDGNDTLTAGSGADLLRGGSGNDRLIAGSGNDSLFGDAGNDTLKGEGGNDYLQDASGNNWMDGGDGNDVISAGAGADTLLGGNGNDLMGGGAGNDVLYGQYGNDTMRGYAGNDRIGDSFGNNLLEGGDGNDRLVTGAGADLLRGDAGNDYLAAGAGNDRMNGGSGNDVMLGQAGNDYLWAGSGNDLLDGGDGNDSLYAVSGTDTLRGGAGNDWLFGGIGINALLGGSGDDRLYGERYGDRMWGDAGRDVMWGRAGSDVMRGGSGSDLIYGEAGNDTMFGGADNDRLSGGSGNNKLFGEAGHDRLLAMSGKDYLSGGSGRDTIIAGAGADTIIGGWDADVLTGGSGADIFRYLSSRDSRRGATDLITDFTSDQDRLDLRTLNLDYVGNDAFSARPQLRWTHQGGDTHVLVDLNGDRSADMLIVLDGTLQLDAGDFLL